MPAAHRDTDLRACGASTISSQGRNVFVNGLLLSVDGDANSHGAGNLIAVCKNVFVGGKMAVNVGDLAIPDGLCIPLGGPHCLPAAVSGSSNVFIGD